MEKKFLSAEDVAAYMEISVSKAYKMISIYALQKDENCL